MKIPKYLFISLIFLIVFYFVKNTTITINVNTPSFISSVDSIPSNIISSDTYQLHNIKYVKESSHLPMDDDMILENDKEFNNYENEYKELIANTFSPKQTKAIKEIIISNSSSFNSSNGDESIGLCSSTIDNNNKASCYILIASKNSDHLFTLLHECCHALYHDNTELFKHKYMNRWEALNNQYVSDYAYTNIEEDFAETGATYLSENYKNSEIQTECKEKLKLFEEFYNETK